MYLDMSLPIGVWEIKMLKLKKNLELNENKKF